jgi:hypothetical protein
MKRISLAFALIFCFVTFLNAQKTDTLTTASGIKYFLTKKGSGRLIQKGEVAVWHYKFTLTDGTIMDDSREKKAALGEKVPSERIVDGLNEILLMMHIGDRGVFIVPPGLGYGQRGLAAQGNFPGIRPNSTLVFDIEMIDIKKESMSELLETALLGKSVSDTSKPHVAEMIALYMERKQKKFVDLYRSDEDLNTIGYMLLERYPEEALKVFKLNVEEYPAVSNVYDSLGEGYMKLGDFEKAILNYQKSLELDPKNKNAEEAIRKMKAKRAKAVNTM